MTYIPCKDSNLTFNLQIWINWSPCPNFKQTTSFFWFCFGKTDIPGVSYLFVLTERDNQQSVLSIEYTGSYCHKHENVGLIILLQNDLDIRPTMTPC